MPQIQISPIRDETFASLNDEELLKENLALKAQPGRRMPGRAQATPAVIPPRIFWERRTSNRSRSA